MPPLHVFDALQVRGYRFYWFSSILVSSARCIQGVVLGWLVLELTNSAFMVTVAGALTFLPMLGLGLFTGILADKLNRRVVLIGTQIASATASLILGILIATNLIQVWEIMAISLTLGLVWSLDWPCRQMIVMDLAGEQNLLNGVALDQGAFNLMSIIGSIIGGDIIATLGMGSAYYIMSAMYLVAALFLFMIGRTQQTRGTSNGSIRNNIKEGVKYSINNRAILGVLLIMIAANGILFPFRSLFPIFARDILKTGPEGLGYIAAAPGVGALLGAVVIASIRRSRPSVLVFAAGAVAMGSLTIIFALSTNYLFSLVVLATVGVATSIYTALQSSIPLRLSSPEMRGRVMGLLSLVIGAMPLGMMAVGIMTDRVGAPAVVFSSSIIGVILVAGVFLLVPGLRKQTYNVTSTTK